MTSTRQASRGDASQSASLRVDYVPLGELQRWPRNPKEHDLPNLDKSISRFGFTEPLLVDERSGRLVVGHGRLESLQAMKEAGREPPARIQLREDGEWLVPVIRGVTFNSDSEAEAYLVASNQLTMAGGWNDPELALLLGDLSVQGGEMLDGTGFSPEAVDALLKRILPPEGEFRAFDETVSGDVEFITCPSCGAQIPK